MKFQVSFDGLDNDRNLYIAEQIGQYADIIEIGSLPIFKYGIECIKQFRTNFPKHNLFADTKIVDRGRDVTSLFSQAGADWISVMAGTNTQVIHGVCSKAHDLGKRVYLDLLDAKSPGQIVVEAKSLGIDAILFHQPSEKYNTLSISFAEQWEMVKGNTELPIFISSAVTRESIDFILTLNPDGLIVGSAITESDDPVVEARFFYEKCKGVIKS